MKKTLILLALSTSYTSIPYFTSTASSAEYQACSNDLAHVQLNQLTDTLRDMDIQVRQYELCHNLSEEDHEAIQIGTLLHLKENAEQATFYAEAGVSSIDNAQHHLNVLVQSGYYQALIAAVTAHTQNDQEARALAQQIAAQHDADAQEEERLAAERVRLAAISVPHTHPQPAASLNNVSAAVPIQFYQGPLTFMFDKTKPFALATSFLGDENQANLFLSTLNQRHATNRIMPGRYVGLTNEQSLAIKLQWIKAYATEIHAALECATRVFDNRKQTESDLSGTDRTNPDIIVIPNSILFDLSAGLDLNGMPTRLLANPRYNLVDRLFSLLRQNIDTFRVSAEADAITYHGLHIDNTYNIGRSIVEIQSIKHTAKEQYQEFMKLFIQNMASAGGHCGDGVRDASRIYSTAKTYAHFTDNLTEANINTVDQKVQYLLLQLREETFLNLSNFVDDHEPGATQTNFRRALAERFAIPSTSSAACGSVGRTPYYTETNMYTDRFFNGKVGNPTGYSAEERKSYEGYTPKRIFTALWNALNHPRTNEHPLDEGFPGEFVESFCEETPVTAPIFQDIIASKFFMRTYCSYTNTGLFDNHRDVTNEDIEDARRHFREDAISADEKKVLLEIADHIKKDQITNRFVIVNHEIIIEHLQTKRIIN